MRPASTCLILASTATSARSDVKVIALANRMIADNLPTHSADIGLDASINN